MNDKLEQVPDAAPGVSASAAIAEVEPAEAEADSAAPVVLADAMCGAFCSLKSETRLA